MPVGAGLALPGRSKQRPYVFMNIRALLFDFNGVILDDEEIHCSLFKRVLLEEDIDLTDEDYWNHYVGYDDKGLFQALLERDLKPATPKKIKTLIEKKATLYLSALPDKLKFLPGVLDFIRESAKKYRLAVVSGALRPEIDAALKAGKVDPLFSIIVSAEETKHGKPDPEGYLLGLARLKKMDAAIRPDNCLVIEDTLAGIESAHRAQMKCVALSHTYPADQLKIAEAVCKDFGEVKIFLEKN